MKARLLCLLRGHNWTRRTRPILPALDNDTADVTTFGTNLVRCRRCGRTAA